MAKTDPVKLEYLKQNKEEFEKLLRKYYVEEDLTAEETGVRLGISRFHVRNYMAVFGIKRRNRGQRKGARSMNWKGGRRKQNGYVLLYRPEHSRAQAGYVFEHILVAENNLGRKLKYFGKSHPDNEVVHHINRKRDDNRWENLEVTTQRDHISSHFVRKNDAETALGSLIADRCLAGDDWDTIADAVLNFIKEI